MIALVLAAVSRTPPTHFFKFKRLVQTLTERPAAHDSGAVTGNQRKKVRISSDRRASFVIDHHA
jgi:hypothetical protein